MSKWKLFYSELLCVCFIETYYQVPHESTIIKKWKWYPELSKEWIVFGMCNICDTTCNWGVICGSIVCKCVCLIISSGLCNYSEHAVYISLVNKCGMVCYNCQQKKVFWKRLLWAIKISVRIHDSFKV